MVIACEIYSDMVSRSTRLAYPAAGRGTCPTDRLKTCPTSGTLEHSGCNTNTWQPAIRPRPEQKLLY